MMNRSNRKMPNLGPGLLGNKFMGGNPRFPNMMGSTGGMHNMPGAMGSMSMPNVSMGGMHMQADIRAPNLMDMPLRSGHQGNIQQGGMMGMRPMMGQQPGFVNQAMMQQKRGMMSANSNIGGGFVSKQGQGMPFQNPQQNMMMGDGFQGGDVGNFHRQQSTGNQIGGYFNDTDDRRLWGQEQDNSRGFDDGGFRKNKFPQADEYDPAQPTDDMEDSNMDFDVHMNSMDHQQRMHNMSNLYQAQAQQQMQRLRAEQALRKIEQEDVRNCRICLKEFIGTFDEHRASEQHKRKERLTKRGCHLCKTGSFTNYTEYVQHIDSENHKQAKVKLNKELGKEDSEDQAIDRKRPFPGVANNITGDKSMAQRSGRPMDRGDGSEPAKKTLKKADDPKPGANSKYLAPSKPVVNSKPLGTSNPVANSKPLPPSKPVANSKPLTPSTPVVTSKTSTPSKPMVNSKSLAPSKPVSNTKVLPPSKPVPKANASKVVASPVTNNIVNSMPTATPNTENIAKKPDTNNSSEDFAIVELKDITAAFVDENDLENFPELESIDLPTGQEFIVPAQGWLCQLCHEFFTNENTAKVTHCKLSYHVQRCQEGASADGCVDTSVAN